MSRAFDQGGAFLAGASCQLLLSPLAASPLPFAACHASPLFLAGWLAVKLLQDALSVFMADVGKLPAVSVMASIIINYALLLLVAIAFRSCGSRRRAETASLALPVPLGRMAASGAAFFLLSDTACFLQCSDGSPCRLFPPMYPFALAGYAECLMAGLPFLFRQMASSLCLAAVSVHGSPARWRTGWACLPFAGRIASRSPA